MQAINPEDRVDIGHTLRYGIKCARWIWLTVCGNLAIGIVRVLWGDDE